MNSLVASACVSIISATIGVSLGSLPHGVEADEFLVLVRPMQLSHGLDWPRESSVRVSDRYRALHRQYPAAFLARAHRWVRHPRGRSDLLPLRPNGRRGSESAPRPVRA